MNFKLIVLLVGVFYLKETMGHGMMLEPPSRSSLWKFYPVDNARVVPNYKNNEVFCGGYALQWNNFGGKCGVCGDPYNAPHPQDNENSGKYGKFGPVRTYSPGSVMKIKVQLTNNHKGRFKYSLCKLDDASKPESGEKCFKPLKLKNGRSQYRVNPKSKFIYNSVKLPDGLKCERCVLRWEYIIGTNKGTCRDGRKRLGCGPQETFRNCADIIIR